MTSDRKYKLTEIGEVPVDWRIKPLPSLLSYIVDNRGKTVPTSQSGIPLIATNCIKENALYPVKERLRYLTQETYENWFRSHPIPNDILFVNKGTPGQVCLVPESVDFCVAQDMVALRANPEEIYWKFLFAYLRSRYFKKQVEGLNVGTTIPHLKKSVFNQLLIPVPSEQEQLTIGDLYFELSNKIELNLQMNQTLEAMAQAIFKEWFINFNFPGFDGELVDGLPKGWRMGTIKDVCVIKYGKDHKNLEEGEIPVYGSGGIMRYANQAIYNNHSILIPRKGTLSNLFYVSSPFWSVDTMFYTIIKSQFLQKYLFYLLKSLNLASRNVGSAVPSLTTEVLNKIEIIIPDDKTLEAFELLVSSFYSKLDENNNQIKSLTQIRDSLLPKLMTGKIEIQA